MCGVVFERMSLSTTMDGVQSSVMGLYDAGLVGDLLGLSSVIILPIFHREGMMQCEYEKLAMLVSVVMPWMPRCFMCMLEMLSWPMAPEFFRCFMTLAVSCGVASVAVLSSVNLCLRLFMALSSLCFGR